MCTAHVSLTHTDHCCDNRYMKRFCSLASSLLLSFGIGISVLVIFLFTLPHSTVFAQTQNWRTSSFGAEFDAADAGEVNSGAYVDRTNSATMVSFACQMSPMMGFCSEDPIKISELQNRSVVGIASNIIEYTFISPPASTYAFIQDMGQTLGFIPKQTYAQGLGFRGLSPLLPLWKVFRNIAYMLLALVMLVIGFMVMFRKKIDPKTVVTVQNALPRVVITLLLVTFSYAIVGIVIELMYVAILVIYSIFKSSLSNLFPGLSGPQLYLSGGLGINMSAVGLTPWQILGVPITIGASNGGTQIMQIPIIGSLWAIPNILAAALNTIKSGGVFFAGMAFISSTLVYLILCIAMVILAIRLLILFLTAYIQIVIALLFGPIQILFEAIPGSTSFSSWLKNLIGNVAVFPIGAGMFMLANVFVTFANNQNNGNLWAPPYVNIMDNVTSLCGLIALGILFTIPTIAKQVKEALKAKSPVDGGGLSGLVGFGATAAQYGFQYWSGKRNMEQQTRAIKGAPWMDSTKNLPVDGGGGGGGHK
jgi:hypothetical protein